MPAAVVPLRTATLAQRRATWSLLEVARPASLAEPLGILLVDEETDRMILRLRDKNDFSDLDEQELDFLEALAADLQMKSAEMGGHSLIRSFEDSLSGFLRIGDRTAVEYLGDTSGVVNRLFDAHVLGQKAEVKVLPFVTHLPLYGLRVAATQFGDEFEASEVNEPDAWVQVPQGLRLRQGMFVAQVVGRSMEPMIPDGSFCVFRAPVTGTRQGKYLLIEQTGGHGKDGKSQASDVASRYTVKRYKSKKTQSSEGFDEAPAWEHASIRLEPLNPEFEAFELGPADFRVIAEFVQVLPS
jgi:SOS-response transcriptional repressor LexA